MPAVRQLSFAAGEIAPAVSARVDQVRYATGLKTLRNMFVMRHGGATNRPGTTFIGEVKDSTKATRLLKFVFSPTQTYILEFGDQYFRVIQDQEHLSDLSLTITNITQASPAVLTYTGTDPTSGQEFRISGVVGMTEVNGRNFKIANVNTVANTFQLIYMNGDNVDSNAFGAYTSGGTAERIYTVSTPYAEAHLFDLHYVQSADVITIVHPEYDPRELTRSGATSWSLTQITYSPSISPPTNLNSGSAGTTNHYVVTSVKGETFEESLQSNSLACGSAEPTPDAPIDIDWTGASGAVEYNVYRRINDIYGLVGVAGGSDFHDIGVTPDTTDTPPTARTPFSGSNAKPSTVNYIQQRIAYANTDDDPEGVYMSRVGMYKNFTISRPLQDDDAITFKMVGSQINAVRHLLDLGQFIVMTETGEHVVIGGGTNGSLVPGGTSTKQQSYNGSSKLRPLIVNSTALYVQARGSIVRDLIFNFQEDKYAGDDLTIFSSHLVDGHEIVDWDYQKTPHSVVWAARDDGTVIGLTYVREQQVIGWHRHDFDGEVESVAVIPEGDEDFVYFVIQREINGESVRYIERMASRRIDDIVDNIFMDCAATYDGRNTDDAHTMTLSGGTTWDHDDTLTLTSSASFFESTDIGNEIFLTGSDGTFIRCEITAYTSATVVSVRPSADVPVVMRSTAISDWSRAVDQVTGLWHLEGESVSVFGDATVVASPNNAAYSTSVTVTDGTISLGENYSVIHVGLPYTCDLQTLAVDTAAAETLSNKKKHVKEITAHFEKTRGVFAGFRTPDDDDVNPLQHLTEFKIRDEESYDEPVDLLTGLADVTGQSEWSDTGSVFLRQVDPIPVTILSITADGLFPFR